MAARPRAGCARARHGARLGLKLLHLAHDGRRRAAVVLRGSTLPVVDADFEIRELAAQATAVVTGHVPPAELPSFFEHAFHDVADALRGQGVAIAGPPFGFYPSMPAETIEVEAGFPVARAIEPAGRVVSGELPGGRVVRALHVGPFEGLSTTYAAVRDWIVAQGLETRAGVWECYLSDPAREPDPATWRTEIFWPIA